MTATEGSVGLVPPSARTDGGFRLYTETDVERLLLIRRMKPLGFTLEEMAELLELVARLDAPGAVDVTDGTRDRLDAYVASAEERRADLARKVAWADELIALLRSR